MNKRIAKKVMKWSIIGQVVSSSDHSTRLGVGFMSTYPDHKVIEAMARLPKSKDSTTWNTNPKYNSKEKLNER